MTRNTYAARAETTSGRGPTLVTKLVGRSTPLRRPSLSATLIVGDIVALSLAAGQMTGLWMAVIALHLLLAGSRGLYRSRLSLLLLDELPGVFTTLVTAAAVVAVEQDLVQNAAAVDGFWGTVAKAAVALALVRGVIYAGARMARSRRLVNHPTLIVGAGTIGHQLAQALIDHPEYGLRPVGFYDQEADETIGFSTFTGPDKLDESVKETGASVVLVAFPKMTAEQLVKEVRSCDRLRSEIFYVPRLFDLHSLSNRDVDDVWGLPLVRLRRATLRSVMWRCKRILDIVTTSAMLIILAPVVAVVALLVLLIMGRPVIFRQRRVGLDGRSFWIFKFRSLPNEDIDLTDTGWTPTDRKPGKFGAFLRMTSLDELPQLWNVVRGEMSLVGPRPEREHFVRQFSDDYMFYADRLRVPAGLTGLAQINGLRGDTSIDERARFDNAYVERWSLSADIKILLRTPLAALRSRGK